MATTFPINRLTPYYHAVRKSHEHFERIFRHWRDRYGVAGKNADTRLKRPGLPFQQLRASAALVIEWFRICKRYGWLGSARRRDLGELRKVDGMKRLKSVLETRKRRRPCTPLWTGRGQARARARRTESLAASAASSFANAHRPTRPPGLRPA